jgi:hypothetical protein
MPVKMLFHVPPEAQRVAQGDEFPAVGGQILIHIDHHEVSEADFLLIAAVRQDLVLPHRSDGHDKDDPFSARGFGGKIFLEQIGGKPGDQRIIVGENLNGDTGIFSDAIFGYFERIHACRVDPLEEIYCSL